MEKKYKIFKLGEAILNQDYYKYEILELDEIFLKSFDGELSPRSGATGLLRAPEEYKGCSQLYYVCTRHIDNNGVCIEFQPAYTENGEFILIETTIETPFVIFCTEYKFTEEDKNPLSQVKAGYLTYKIGGWWL